MDSWMSRALVLDRSACVKELRTSLHNRLYTSTRELGALRNTAQKTYGASVWRSTRSDQLSPAPPIGTRSARPLGQQHAAVVQMLCFDFDRFVHRELESSIATIRTSFRHTAAEHLSFGLLWPFLRIIVRTNACRRSSVPIALYHC